MNAKAAFDAPGASGLRSASWMRGCAIGALAIAVVVAASHNMSNVPERDAAEGGSVADDTVVLQFAHAAPAAPRLDVYVITREAALVISRHVATLSPSETNVPFELMLARDHDDGTTLTGKLIVELRATETGQTLYRSEEIEVVERSRMLFAIGDARGTGSSPVRVSRVR